MGRIRDEVMSGEHLRQRPGDRAILAPFLHNFDVTWARASNAHNAKLSLYFLKPDETVEHQFGIKEEILLAISDFQHVQPRSLQAIEQVMHDLPARGRVDPTLFFFVSNDINGRNWMKDHSGLNPQSRIPVMFHNASLKQSISDNYFVRREISDQLFSRDLFNEQLPLTNDLFFVGRDNLVAEYLTAIKQNHNRGLFGLRKTGKTSVLFKVARLAERDDIKVYYYDCKRPSIRNSHWGALIVKIATDMLSHARSNLAKGQNEHPSDYFLRALKVAGKRNRVCLIFDEIEYITPLAKLDKHWHREFIEFWQTLWAAQSEMRCLSFIVAGVNPTIIELDLIDGVQNPVFSIVKPEYLTGLTYTEVSLMLSQLGNRMGINFTPGALSYIYKRYGGHPLLTRMACSHFHSHLIQKNIRRPAVVNEQQLIQTEEVREEAILIYCRHVISELSTFYPEEYEILEMLASGNVAGFMDGNRKKSATRHLQGYGLVDIQPQKKPEIKLPVITRYINAERAEREGSSDHLFLVPSEERSGWLSDRVRRITNDIRRLEKIATERGMPRLYGENGFPEAEKFASVEVCNFEKSFTDFINVCNRCFVEPIERLGSSRNIKNYFWINVKDAYPELWHALLRIKLYRNEKMHLQLTENVEDRLREMLAGDFMGDRLDRLSDPYFRLQQAVINGLFVGVQVDLDKLL